MATLSKYASVKLTSAISTTADPTGAAPSFAVLDPDADTDPTDNWVTGEWGTWDASTFKVDAITPTMPSAASSIDASTPDTYHVWLKFTVGGETFIEQFDTLVVT